MDYWNLLFLVLLLGFAVVAPVIVLVVAVRGLGSHTLSEKQRRAGEEELRKAGIVREGETWEARDLDELMLNMRRYDQWQRIGIAITVLLTGGVGVVALIAIAGGMVNADVYMTPIGAIWWSSVTLGVSVGYLTTDRRFAARVGELPIPRSEAIFSGAGGVLRRPQWLRVLDVGLIAGVSFVTLLYALGKGGALENAATNLAVARHPWLLWCTPVALCIIVVTRELMVQWEMRRPPLRLTEQAELAGCADLYQRREASKWFYNTEVCLPVSWLFFFQLDVVDSQTLSPIRFPLFLVALGTWIVNLFVYSRAESRRTRQGQGASDVGLRGGGEVV